jgi:GIY-YIG catalytic domain.
MRDFYYVYILVSDIDDERHYSGVTRDLKARLVKYNGGKCPHTAKHGKLKSRSRSDLKLKLTVSSVI